MTVDINPRIFLSSIRIKFAAGQNSINADSFPLTVIIVNELEFVMSEIAIKFPAPSNLITKTLLKKTLVVKRFRALVFILNKNAIVISIAEDTASNRNKTLVFIGNPLEEFEDVARDRTGAILGY
jgi:hypothetical protein